MKEARMRTKALVVLPIAVIGILLVPAAAQAHTVGVPGTPNCFGQRVSHGSSAHGLTPKERATALQEIVNSGDPLAVAFFGDTVTVGEFAEFVKLNCSDTPVVP
jgi:hypothetical protein